MGFTYFQALTLLASAIALIVSFRVQRQLLRLQRLQEQLTRLQIAERKVQIKAEVVDGESIVLRPFLAEQDVNSVTIHFPSELKVAPIALAAPDLDIPLTRFATALQRFWDSRTPPTHDHAKVRLTAILPVVLEIYGHTKGVAVFTRAFYNLYARYMRLPNGASEQQIRGLSLNNYLAAEQNTQLALEEAFSETLVAISEAETHGMSDKKSASTQR